MMCINAGDFREMFYLFAALERLGVLDNVDYVSVMFDSEIKVFDNK